MFSCDALLASMSWLGFLCIKIASGLGLWHDSIQAACGLLVWATTCSASAARPAAVQDICHLSSKILTDGRVCHHQVKLPKGLLGTEAAEVQLLSSFHGGSVTGMAALPGQHRVLTTSLDGSLRTWNCRYRLHIR